MEINVFFLQVNTLSDLCNESNEAVFFRRNITEAIYLEYGALTATKALITLIFITRFSLLST